MRDFVFIDDVVASLRAVILDPPGGDAPRFDIGSGVGTTIAQLAEAIARFHSAPAPHVTGAFRDGDVRHAETDIGRSSSVWTGNRSGTSSAVSPLSRTGLRLRTRSMSPRRAQGPGGAPLIIGATVAAGVAGYVVTWLVYRHIGPAPYALFAIFWAALYLVIGGLSGIQQEITRATRAVDPGSPPRANRARTFGVVAAVGVATLVVATAPLWQQPVFAHDGWQLAIPLAVGAGAYVMVATLSGSLYGLAKWRAVAALIALDGVLRVLLVGIALAVSPDVVVLAGRSSCRFPSPSSSCGRSSVADSSAGAISTSAIGRLPGMSPAPFSRRSPRRCSSAAFRSCSARSTAASTSPCSVKLTSRSP